MTSPSSMAAVRQLGYSAARKETEKLDRKLVKEQQLFGRNLGKTELESKAEINFVPNANAAHRCAPYDCAQ